MNAQQVIDAIAEQVTERLTKGVTVDIPRTTPRPTRPVERFSGDAPVGKEGLSVPRFQTQKKCGVKYILKDGKEVGCPINLTAERIWHAYLEVAYNNPQTAQLKYDKTKWDYFLTCPIHGPVPPEGNTQPPVKVSEPP